MTSVANKELPRRYQVECQRHSLTPDGGREIRNTAAVSSVKTGRCRRLCRAFSNDPNSGRYLYRAGANLMGGGLVSRYGHQGSVERLQRDRYSQRCEWSLSWQPTLQRYSPWPSNQVEPCLPLLIDTTLLQTTPIVALFLAPILLRYLMHRSQSEGDLDSDRNLEFVIVESLSSIDISSSPGDT